MIILVNKADTSHIQHNSSDNSTDCQKIYVGW